MIVNKEPVPKSTKREVLRRDEYQCDFDKILRAAKEFGVILEINAYPERLDLNDQNIRRAKEAGVKMVLENNGKPGCWRYTDFDQPTHIFLTLVEGIRGSSIEVNFDTANPVVYGDNPLGALEKVIDKVYSIHAADTKTKGVLNHVLLGTGLVPFKELFSYLKKSGFDGWICMEENSRLAERGVKAAAAFIQKQWRDA